MNIIICGAGRVGFTIAKLLSEQGHSITVIDQSSEDIQKINDSLDVKAIVGKGTYPSILEKANANDADMIIAVTRNEYDQHIATHTFCWFRTLRPSLFFNRKCHIQIPFQNTTKPPAKHHKGND